MHVIRLCSPYWGNRRSGRKSHGDVFDWLLPSRPRLYPKRLSQSPRQVPPPTSQHAASVGSVVCGEPWPRDVHLMGVGGSGRATGHYTAHISPHWMLPFSLSLNALGMKRDLIWVHQDRRGTQGFQLLMVWTLLQPGMPCFPVIGCGWAAGETGR